MVSPGERYGRYVVLRTEMRRDAKNRAFRLAWCRCDCGAERRVRANNLQSGSCVSCGCYIREVLKSPVSRAKVARSLTRHGHASKAHRSPEYVVWLHIIARCTNPHETAYEHYGGRGIKLCDRWRANFEAFLSDMGPRPSAKHKIERMNNDGNYEPGNCRWATHTEQVRNRRVTKMVEYRGQRMALADAVELAGLNYQAVNMRLHRGWSVERALGTSLEARRAQADCEAGPAKPPPSE